MISNLRKHLKTLHSVVKHARNVRRKKIQEECEIQLRDALKDKTNRKSMENAVNLAKRSGMTSLDLYTKTVRALESLKRCEASERSLKTLWNQTKSRIGSTVSDSTRQKNVDALRDAVGKAERCNSDKVELIRDVRKYLEETSLELAANSAFKLMNLQTLEILLKEASTKKIDTSFIDMKIVVVRRVQNVQEGLRSAMEMKSCEEIERYLKLANAHKSGIPSWCLVDLRKQARALCDELRKQELQNKDLERRQREAERRCTKQANRLLRQVEEIREGLRQGIDAKDSAVLTHWISIATTSRSRLEAFLSKEKRLGEKGKCPKSLRNEVENNLRVLSEEKTNAEKLSDTFLNALREESKQQQPAAPPTWDQWNGT